MHHNNEPLQKILIVAAAERHNFGDWLLAWTATQILKQTTTSEVKWFALGGLGRGVNEFCGPYIEIGEALTWEPDFVLHVGGETIGCGLDSAYRMSFGSSIVPPSPQMGRQSAYITPQSEIIGSINHTWPSRAFFGLGGNHDQVKCSDTAVALRTAAAPVRCRTSSARDSLLGANVPAVCAPDLVHYLPHLHEARRAVPGSYVAVQVSKEFYEQNCNFVLLIMRTLAKRHKQIVLFVAGVAFGHDSVRTLMEAKEAVLRTGECERIFVHVPLHPLDIVDLIAGADLVVSSSLHAGIVAHAYGVPHATWFSQKAASYFQEWETGSQVLENNSGAIRTEILGSSGDGLGRQPQLGLVAREEWITLTREIGVKTHEETERYCTIADEARFGFALEQRRLCNESLVAERDVLLVEREGLVAERNWWFGQFRGLQRRRSVRFALRLAVAVSRLRGAFRRT